MRELAPACLRYQFLQGGPPKLPFGVGAVTAVAGGSVAAAAALATGTLQLLLAVPVAAAAATGLATTVLSFVPSLQKDPRNVPVGLVPWGLIVDPDGKPEPYPWKAVREITYELVSRDRRESADAPKLCIMRFDLGDFRVRASAEEGEWVVTVSDGHQRLALAARQAPSSTLDGHTALSAADLPAPLALLRHAEQLLSTADGRSSLGLEYAGYRDGTTRVVSPETRERLKAAMWKPQGKFDPGPLAVVLAAELGVTSLVPDVLSLITSPSPLLAAVARAGALRLGASRMAAGSLDELALFMPDRELADLRTWAER